MSTENYITFPLEIKDVDPKLLEKRQKYFLGDNGGFVRVGPKKYFLCDVFKHMANEIYNLSLRQDDVFVVTCPRSGTTWTQELVWLVNSDLDYETAAAIPLTKRYSFLEQSFLLSLETDRIVEFTDIATIPGTQQVADAPSPRYVKTHLPLSVLPPKLLDTAKVVYIARDPRDAVVSYYHLHSVIGVYAGDFKTYWYYFVRNMILWTPFFAHIKEAWEKRHHPNLLILFYEDLCKDLPAEVCRVAAFFNKELSKEQMAKLCDHVSFDNFKKNPSVNNHLQELGIDVDPEEGIIRKGKVGGWRDYFDADMTREADNWIADNLKDTDFRFPHLAK